MFETKFSGYFAGKRRCFLDMGGDSTTVQAAPAPDYAPMAQASEKSAQIMADLGNKQLTEAQRQYDTNLAVAKPVADAQLGIMQQTKQQGDEYFNYWKSKAQPVENALNAEAMAAGSDQKQQEAVDRAVADSQGGFTRSINQTLRQARRYGINPVLTGGDIVAGQGQATAAAATGARDKEKQLGFAKKMDVAGLYRGMPGASTGAYSVANSSGNSAVGNTMAPGGALMAGMGQGASTIGSGRSMLQSGLGSVLGAQTSYAGMVTNANIANAQYQNQSDPMMNIIGQGIGAWAGGGFKLSDRRAKENIALVGVDDATGINLYEFNYLGDDRRYRGVMADEVIDVMPDAVSVNEDGFMQVNYGMLGLQMVEV